MDQPLKVPESLEQWHARASLYELVSLSFLLPTAEIGKACASGELAEAYDELLVANCAGDDLREQVACELAAYAGVDPNEAFHAARIEYTRLFVGKKDPLITPYAGVQATIDKGGHALLFVGAESMAIERFMKRCGLSAWPGKNEPMDHIGCMLEFLELLCLVKAEAVEPPRGSNIQDDDFDTFREQHFCSFARQLSDRVLAESANPLIRAGALVLPVL